MNQIATATVLNEILAEWHQWATKYSPLPKTRNSAMFADVKTGRGWDLNGETVESELHSQTMTAVDFQAGEMAEPHRTAIHVNARNCATGRNVWNSPRLPCDLAQRTKIVCEARAMLSVRLTKIGVIRAD